MKRFRFALVFVAAISIFLSTDGAVFADSADTASLVRILQARADNFSALKGKPLPNNPFGDQVWDGKERPFGLWCRVGSYTSNHANFYQCYVCPDHLRCLSTEAIQNFKSKIKAAFRMAASDLNWRELESGRFVGERSPDETVVDGVLVAGDLSFLTMFRVYSDDYIATLAIVEAYKKRAKGHLDRGLYDQSIADYTQLIALTPNDSAPYINRARAFHLAGRDSEGLPDANKGVAIASKYPGAFETRAEIYEKLGQREKAIADYRKALSLDPGWKDATDGLKRLGAAP